MSEHRMNRCRLKKGAEGDALAIGCAVGYNLR